MGHIIPLCLYCTTFCFSNNRRLIFIQSFSSSKVVIDLIFESRQSIVYWTWSVNYNDIQVMLIFFNSNRQWLLAILGKGSWILSCKTLILDLWNHWIVLDAYANRGRAYLKILISWACFAKIYYVRIILITMIPLYSNLKLRPSVLNLNLYYILFLARGVRIKLN